MFFDPKISDHFTGGSFGTDLYELLLYPSKIEVVNFTSSALNRSMKFGIYLPPGYSRSSSNYYPVLYLLLGYNMSVEGMTNSYARGSALSVKLNKKFCLRTDSCISECQGNLFVNQIAQLD